MNKRLLLLFVFCLVYFSSFAQNYGKHAAEINEAAFLKYQKQYQAGELSLDEITAGLTARGVDANEIEKLRNKLLKTKNGADSVATIKQPPRQVKQESFKTFPATDSLSKVFGSSFFSNPSLSFEPNLRIATPSNYTLGPDDELVLNVSGYQETALRLQVSPEGNITIPQVGVINVSGQAIDDAVKLIRSRMIKTAYPSLADGSSRLNISLGNIRSIHITAIGARKSGNFTVSSLTTAFNLLYLCGGPDKINTYREIELIRNNKVYRKIDIYKFLTRGDLSGNIILKENDILNFPVYKKRVVVRGEFKRDGVFDLLESETLDDLVFYAGGFTDRAFATSVKVKIKTETERKIVDVKKSDFKTFKLADGDEIEVAAIPNRLVNGVAIEGAVYRPGDYEFKPGLTLKQLLDNAGGVLEEAFLERVVITRTSPDLTKESISFSLSEILSGKKDFQLNKWDKVTISSVENFRSELMVTVDGEVRNPGVYEYKKNLSLKDLLFFSGGFTDAGASFRIEVSRRTGGNTWTGLTDSVSKVFNINLDRNLADEGELFILKPFDIVIVRKNPGYIEQRKVNIQGEVLFPGAYAIASQKDRISDIIKRAGGLTPYAYAEGFSLIRKNEQEKKNFHDIKKDRIETAQDMLADTTGKVIGEIRKENVKIALNAEQILNNPGSREDYLLEDGDLILVSKKDPLVKVTGEILLNTKTDFVKGKSLRYYLRKSGGATERAKLSKAYVVYANGDLDKRSKGFLGMFRSFPQVKPGSEIVVPRKEDRKRANVAETVGIVSTIISILSLTLLTTNSLSN